VAGRPSSVSPEGARVAIPALNLDPIWSLRPWPVVLTLSGWDYTIPALPAADWLAVLMRTDFDLDDMILDLLPPEVDDLLVQGLDLSDLHEACLDLIELVSARRWWITMRLISVARDHWHELGPSVLRGAPADRVSLSAWLDVLTVTIMKAIEPKEATMFVMKLEAVPENESVPEEEMGMSADSFLSLAR
jgi:hypothetical protein